MRAVLALSTRASAAVGLLAAGAVVCAAAGVASAAPSSAGDAMSGSMGEMAPCVHFSAGTEAEMRRRHMEMPGPSACTAFRPALSSKGWRATASSAATGHPASAVLHTRGAAYWLSGPVDAARHRSQSVTITLDTARRVSGLSYVAPSVRGTVGTVGQFRVATSADGRHFGAPVASGRWQNNKTTKQVQWTPRTVRAVRLTVLGASPARATRVAVSQLRLTGVGTVMRTPMGRSAAAVSTSPSVVGKWGPSIGFPIIPVAAALVPGNKMIIWSADSAESFDSNTPGQTYTAVYDLATGAISSSVLTATNHNMFCPGVAVLADGRLLVAGGIGDTMTSIYDPRTNSWSAGPRMNIGRGYQSDVTLSDGQVFTLGGSWSGAIGGKIGEIYSASGGWRELPSVSADPIDTADAEGTYRSDNHGWFFAAKNGTVFHAGPSKQMNWITTAGAGSITSAGTRGTAPDEMNGDAVMYDVNKILYAGGSPDYQNSDATARAGTIDLSGGPGVTPKTAATASMAYARGFANGVVLPTGSVLTVGGETHPIPFDDSTSVLTPELWNPASGTWARMADAAAPRNYHSVALLLPDGTVFSGGGGLCGGCSTNHPDGQIFYPPYLFNSDGSAATRPKIVSAPTTAVTGRTMTVTTGSAVSSFVMMRYDEATHSIDTDQRRIPLSIASQSGTTYTLSIPADPGTAVPGPYMLFAINSQGTPSVSATVTVSTPAVGTPATTYGQGVAATGPALYWPLADAAGSATAADLSGNRTSGVVSSTGVSLGAASPVTGSSGRGATLAGGTIVSSQPIAAPTSYTEQVWFRTTSTGGGQLMRFGESPTSNDGQHDRLVYLRGDGRIAFGVWRTGANIVTSPAAYNDGAWHLVTASQGAGGMRLYVDGTQVAANTAPDAGIYTGYWQVGGSSGDWPDGGPAAFSGTVSDATLWTSQLTATQVKAIAAASTAAGSTSGGSGGTTTPPASGFTATAIVGAGSQRCLDIAQRVTTDGAAAVLSDCGGQTSQKWTLTSSGQLVDANSGKCLDVAGALTDAGSSVIQWTCHGQVNQQWTYRAATHAFVGVQSGSCLDVAGAGTAEGSKLIIWPCHGASNQQWTASG